MTLSSYSDVFSIEHERPYDEEIRQGDIIRTGSNLFPHYEVLAVNGDRAWVRNVQNGADSLISVTRCRKIESHPHLQAAE
jgi:hypothetical protein